MHRLSAGLRSAPDRSVAHAAKKGEVKLKVLGAEQTAPDFAMPPGACDCHIHLFGPTSRYPYVSDRVYTPPPVGLEDLSAMHTALGLERAVVVQASVQGTANTLLLEALSKWPSRLRGVAVISDGVTDAELNSMYRAGVRGIRLNFETHGGVDPAVAKKRLAVLSNKIAPHGLHVQMYINTELLDAIAGQIAQTPCPVVLDHFGRPDPAKGRDAPSFRRLLVLAGQGRIYVKLSALHRVSRSAGYEDMQQFVTALIETNPDRMLWGSDWPHAMATERRNPDGPDPLRAEDDGANLNLLARWISDHELLRKILVENPARLYGF